MSEPQAAPLRTALAGASATFSGVGLARFAYVPLFPAMVAAGWVTGAEGGLLGAVNLAGYLAGVLGGRLVARQVGTRSALDLGMALAVLSFLGCGWNGGLAWLALCRTGSGIAGGLLMALAGPAVQSSVPADRRGLAGGIVMTGVGSGIILGALGMPLLLGAGIAGAWIGLALLVAMLWLAMRPSWPSAPVVVPEGRLPAGALTLCLSYGLAAAGIVPHMVYFVDHLIRGRGLDAPLASLTWTMFGIGALLGPLAGGRLADRIGASAALPASIVLQALAVTLAFTHHPLLLVASACLGGCAAIGMTAIVLARTRDLAGPASGAIWVQATAAFALAQAATGFGYAALFARTGSHDALFGAGLVLSALALLPLLRR